MVPLETIPLYSPNSWPNKFWHLERNTTEWSIMMRELVLSNNALVKLMLQDLALKLRGAHVGQCKLTHSVALSLIWFDSTRRHFCLTQSLR